jgi:hypothetical protein
MSDLFYSHSNIDTFFCNEDVEDIWYENKIDQSEIEKLRGLVKYLSPIDQIIYNSIYIDGARQEDVADQIGQTQGNVNHRMEGIKKSFQFIANLPKIDSKIINKNLRKIQQNRRRSIRAFLITPNLSIVANKQDISSTAVSMHFKKVINDASLDAEFINYLLYLKTAPPKIRIPKA